MALLMKSEKSNCGVLHFYHFTFLLFYFFIFSPSRLALQRYNLAKARCHLS